MENENSGLKKFNKTVEAKYDEKLRDLHDRDIDLENLQLLKENELIRQNEVLKSIEIENENLKNALMIRDDEILCLKNELNNHGTNYESEIKIKYSRLNSDYENLYDETSNLKQTLEEERAEFKKIKEMQFNENESIIKKLNEETRKNEEMFRNFEDLNFELNELKIKHEKTNKDYENLLKLEEDYKMLRASLNESDKIKENYETLQKKYQDLKEKFLIQVSL